MQSCTCVPETVLLVFFNTNKQWKLVKIATDGSRGNMWEQHPVAAASSGQQVGAGGGSLGAASGWSSSRCATDGSHGNRWEQQPVTAATGGQQVGGQKVGA